MRLEAEGDMEVLKRLKAFLETQPGVSDVGITGLADDHDVDLAQITLEKNETGATLGALADEAGMERRVMEDALSVLQDQDKACFSEKTNLWRPLREDT